MSKSSGIEQEELKMDESLDSTDINSHKPGSIVMIKGFPCKITETSTSKPGKHGSAKVILKGTDI